MNEPTSESGSPDEQPWWNNSFVFAIGLVAGINIATLFLSRVLGIDEFFSLMIAAVVAGIGLTVFGFRRRDIHGGLAVFLGLMILLISGVFVLMRFARPELFQSL